MDQFHNQNAGEKRQIVEYICYAAIYMKDESMWQLYVFYLGVQIKYVWKLRAMVTLKLRL